MSAIPSQHPTLAYIEAQKLQLKELKKLCKAWQKRIDSEIKGNKAQG